MTSSTTTTRTSTEVTTVQTCGLQGTTEDEQECPGPIVPCPHRYASFAVVLSSHARAQAGCLCRRIGKQRVADVRDGGDLLVVGRLLHDCMGPSDDDAGSPARMAWIGSYGRLTDDRCLVAMPFVQAAANGTDGPILGRADPCTGDVRLPIVCS